MKSFERMFSGYHCQLSSESRVFHQGIWPTSASHTPHSKTHKLKELTDGNKNTRGDFCKQFKSLNFQHLLHTEETAGVLC